jgi:hypothetical protein
MRSIEQKIKQQFARVFQVGDWQLFKRMAEFYLRSAAYLRTSDITAPSYLKLLARNSQKRLFIGVGVELLLKAVYLKGGYAINRHKSGSAGPGFPFKLDGAMRSQLVANETFLLDELIGNVKQVVSLKNREGVLRGLKIAKVFRNKEGHTVTAKHVFDPSNYRDIEVALRELYRVAFDEILTIRFSLAPNEMPLWRIRPLSPKGDSH